MFECCIQTPQRARALHVMELRCVWVCGCVVGWWGRCYFNGSQAMAEQMRTDRLSLRRVASHCGTLRCIGLYCAIVTEERIAFVASCWACCAGLEADFDAVLFASCCDYCVLLRHIAAYCGILRSAGSCCRRHQASRNNLQ